MTQSWPDDDVILYDGVCVFCSRWVRFVAARDVERRFRFTAIQSAGNTVILVTHEEDIANYAHRIVRLRDGLIESDRRRSTQPALV